MAEFMAMDVAGRWLPGLIHTVRQEWPKVPTPMPTSQADHATGTKPSQDQFQKIKTTAQHVWQQFPWQAAAAETAHEFMIGPSLILLPTVVHEVSRRTFFARSAAELGRVALSDFPSAFKAYLETQHAEFKGPVSKAQFKGWVKDFYSKHLFKLSDAELNFVSHPDRNLTVGKVLEHYGETLGKHVFKHDLPKPQQVELDHALHEATRDFQKAVKRMNRQLHPEKALNNNIRAIGINVPGSIKRDFRKTYRIVEEFPRFNELLKATFDLHQANPERLFPELLKETQQAVRNYRTLLLFGILAAMPFYLLGLTRLVHQLEPKHHHVPEPMTRPIERPFAQTFAQPITQPMALVNPVPVVATPVAQMDLPHAGGPPHAS